MRYGTLPKNLGVFEVDCLEMMFYQDMLIKDKQGTELKTEERLNPFNELLGVVSCHFVGEYGLDRYVNSYVYISAKNIYQATGCPFNRPGWHTDGFMSNDINYVWSDKFPTIFNTSEFSLTNDHNISIKEMTEQALPENDMTFPNGTLLRLNQYNVHRVPEIDKQGMRCFLKVSFSDDRFDLKGNTINPLIKYNWEMKDRQVTRNVPKSKF